MQNLFDTSIFYLTPPKLIPIQPSNTQKDIDKWKESEMGIRNLSENIIVAELPSDGSERADELKNLNEKIGNQCHYDVIVDFSKVEIINSWNISNLLILRGMLEDTGRKLILCNISTITRCIFVVAGLNEIFIFADNRSDALAAIRDKDSPVTANPR
jgi:anti-anti-sigma regulatory factor